MKTILMSLILLTSSIQTFASDQSGLSPVGATLLRADGKASIYLSCAEKKSFGCNKIVAVVTNQPVKSDSKVVDVNYSKLTTDIQNNLQYNLNESYGEVIAAPGVIAMTPIVFVGEITSAKLLPRGIQKILFTPFIVVGAAIDLIALPATGSAYLMSSFLHRNDSTKLVEAMLNPNLSGKVIVSKNYNNFRAALNQ